jgi:hypothetical protein
MAYLPRWEWAWQRVKENLGEAVAVGVLSLIIALGAGMNDEPAAIGVGVGGALLWSLIRFSWYASRARIVQERAQLVEHEKENTRLEEKISSLAAEAPPLVVDYEFISAPTSVPAGTMIRTIKLDYTEPEPEMVVISFEKETPMEYRMGRPSWCLCTVRNQGGKRLLSGQLVFDSEFFEGEYVTVDNVRVEQSIRVSLPFIESGDTLEFYMMNVSGLNVRMTTPKTATIQLEGETHSRTARVHTSLAGMARPSGSTLTFYT